MMRWITALILLGGLMGGAVTAAAETPAQMCSRVGTDDTLRPLPPAYATAAGRSLGVQAPATVIAATTVYRCAARQPLICNSGANLVCGKADTRRRLPAAEAFCRANPGSAVVPAVVTGHATSFTWVCRGEHAVAGPPAEALDARGFKTDLWKRLR